MLTKLERELVRMEGNVNQLWASLEQRLPDIERMIQTGQSHGPDGTLILALLHAVAARITLQQQQRALLEETTQAPPTGEQA